MKLMTKTALSGETKSRYEALQGMPITVLQIGEGNFLRGFFDWMFNECLKQGLMEGGVAVVQPRPAGREKIRQLAEQDGLYTLVIRGMEEGVPVSRREVIPVFSDVFDPYEEWGRFAELAASPHLRIVVSNTTEAGLVFRPESLGSGPILSFPGKITYLLFQRYQAFKGAKDSGLVFLPCELLEQNGDTLRNLVLQYAKDWNLPEDFREWVQNHNRFLNSLVDRIVTGYPDLQEAETWFKEWGVRDPLLCTAEPYHLWAIEAEPELEKLLPFRKAGLNVYFTKDLKPFQQRKVSILNGAHTWMAPLGLIYGLVHVRELLEHRELGQRVKQAVLNEILPTLPYAREELESYARTVFERFANPYIRHRLEDIAMNALSKFRVRLLPALTHYGGRGEPAPEQLVLGFAGLLRYYRVEQRADGSFAGRKLSGETYIVRDNPDLLVLISEIWLHGQTAGESTEQTVYRLLGEEKIWGQSLADLKGLAAGISFWLNRWEEEEQR
ncbi:tagaturonate reductase [Paenibacillus physcomitrellae]|uniref:Altronate oxidoreductase n=1 Tax=Paenibacillus physcomitrellae TaxID=1619311 RepID=A0ABQ1FRY7_9BACL|nr:tagaturonate reductase [Paenibacillus physcomitrellae]GGA28614.1 altronate oxidoreductase [Paenibacillus physcomitrellae]